MHINSQNIKSVLITGISGSGGSYLAEYIAEHFPDVRIHGISRWHSTTSSNNLASILSKVIMHECDLNDLSSVIRTLQASSPDAIFHLASHANVRASFDTPLAVIQNNVMATANLFESVRILNICPRIQLCSTSEVYGQVAPECVPIKEDCPLNPASPYAVSKVTQDQLGYVYWKAFGLKIIRTRMFSYLNPRRTDLFATAFAMQVAKIEHGLQTELLHGNLDSIRTVIDVRDAMKAYWDAIQYCTPGEAYNIGGNTTVTVGEFLELLKKMSSREIPSRVNPALLRPSDVTLQIPDTSKFRNATNWNAKYNVEDSIRFLLDYCRHKVSKSSS